MTLRIKNWEKFQHYKNRKPPWIRLYNDLLDDPDFNELDGELVKTLIKIWLAASEHNTDGTLPDIRTLALKIHVASNLLAKQLIKLNHWVENTCEHGASNVLASETETETETENSRDTRRRVNNYSLEFEKFRNEYPRHRHGGKGQDWKSWKLAKSAGMTVETAHEYLNHWKASKKWKTENGKFIVAISKWLRDGYWETMPADEQINHAPKPTPLTKEQIEEERRLMEMDYK